MIQENTLPNPEAVGMITTLVVKVNPERDDSETRTVRVQEDVACNVVFIFFLTVLKLSAAGPDLCPEGGGSRNPTWLCLFTRRKGLCAYNSRTCHPAGCQESPAHILHSSLFLQHSIIPRGSLSLKVLAELPIIVVLMYQVSRRASAWNALKAKGSDRHRLKSPFVSSASSFTS